jgi:hypothetical protein
MVDGRYRPVILAPLVLSGHTRSSFLVFHRDFGSGVNDDAVEWDFSVLQLDAILQKRELASFCKREALRWDRQPAREAGKDKKAVTNKIDPLDREFISFAPDSQSPLQPNTRNRKTWRPRTEFGLTATH